MSRHLVKDLFLKWARDTVFVSLIYCILRHLEIIKIETCRGSLKSDGEVLLMANPKNLPNRNLEFIDYFSLYI